MNQTVQERVLKVIATSKRIPLEAVKPESSFEELNIDSLDRLNILFDLESEFEILGLFSGPDLADLEGGSHAPMQTMIFLYRRPILDYWAEHAEPLGHIVRHVLIHEIGHHFGLSDDDM